MAILYGAVIGGKIYRIDTISGTETIIGDGIDRSYVGVCVDSLGDIYASSSDGYVYKFSRSSNLLMHTYDVASNARSIIYSKSDNAIFVAAYGHNISKIDLSNGNISAIDVNIQITPSYIDLDILDGAGVAVSVGTANRIINGQDFYSLADWKPADINIQGIKINQSGSVWVSGARSNHGSLQYISESGSIVYDYPGYATLWGIAAHDGVMYISSTGGKIYSRTIENISADLVAVTFIDRYWQDICLDSFASGATSVFGAPFQGFERGYSLEISRKISEIPTLGSAPILLPYAPADKDEWIVDAELWVTAAQAAEIQARVPPKGAPLERAISVPPRSGANTFAGLAPANAGGSVDTYLDPVVLSLESLGQKAVAVDLYGFRIRFSLSCSSISNPYSSNPATPPTATPPAWLNQKFRAHQIEDCSTEERVIASTGKWSASPNPIKAGRGLPLSITLDYLTQERADELVAFFRGIRGNTFTASLDFPGATSTTFVARKLSLTRPGLHWEGTLEVYQA